MFTNVPAFDLSKITETVEKLVALNQSVATKAFEAQQSAAQNLLALSQERAKAALEIKDVEGYISFMSAQAEIAKKSVEELVANTQSAAKDAETYFAEVQSILLANQEAAATAKKPAAKKAAA